MAAEEETLDLTVVLPVYNEEESLPDLVAALREALDPIGKSYELLFVDDGSRDGSFRVLKQEAERDPGISIIRFRRNFGQTAALQAGFDAARGDVVVTMDADLQNDPKDIPMMLDVLDEGYDLVAGWRANRKDKLISRKIPSKLANGLISWMTGVKLHDYGCTLKAMRLEVASELRLYGEMHRFIPAIASWMGVRLKEVEVRHHARQYGVSKYGISRTFRVVLDLLVVRFIQSYLARPMQVFGLGGLFLLIAGFGICGWLALNKLLYGIHLADRPLLLLGVLLLVVGIQLVSLGLVADVLARTYFESQGKRTYHVRTRLIGEGQRPRPQGSVRPAAVNPRPTASAGAA